MKINNDTQRFLLSNHKLQKIAFFFFLLLTISLYGMSSWIPRSKGQFPVISGIDGAYYALRLKRALEGDYTITCPFDFHLKSKDTFIPNLLEASWAKILHPVIGHDISLAITITYMVLPALIYVLLVAFLYLIFSEPWLAIFLSYWAVTEDALFFWKPFSLDTIDSSEPLPYFRYANPMIFQPIFLLALGSFLYLCMTVQKKIQNKKNIKNTLVFLTVFLAGLLHYTQFYYISYFLLILIIFGIICLVKKKWRLVRITLFTILGSFILGWPKIIFSFNSLLSPEIMEVVHRIGCMIKNENPYFMYHKGLIFTFLIYQILCWKSWNTKWAFLTSSMIAGYLCLNQTLITHLSNHDHHYFRPMMILYVFLVADSLIRIGKKLSFSVARANQMVYFGIFLCLGYTAKASFLTMKYINQEQTSESNILNNFNLKNTVTFLQQIPKKEIGLILIDPKLTYVVELMTDFPVFINEYFYHCITSDDQLFRRWALLGKFYHWNQNSISLLLRNLIENSNVFLWFYGLPQSYMGPKNNYLLEVQNLKIKAWMNAYEQVDIQDLLRQEDSRGTLPKFAISSAHHELDLETVQTYFKITLLKEFPLEHTKIWSLQPRF